MKELFRKIHTRQFRWYDQFILVGLMTFLLVIAGQILGTLIEKLIATCFDVSSPVMETALMYFNPIGTWIVMILYMLIKRSRRPILKTLGTGTRGNTFKNYLIGLLIGFGLSMTCALVAMANRDIHVHFSRFDPLGLLLVFVCVFIQSSSEEVVDRAYYYQVLRKGYPSPWFAIIISAAVFSFMHIFNPGFTLLSFLNILASGILFALSVYYFDSLWMAFGIHTGWNFTQSILLGLPNSGLVVPFSLFELDTASATDSFVYNVAFGIEGTVFSTILLYVACLVIFLIGRKKGVKSRNIWIAEEVSEEEGKTFEKKTGSEAL